MSVEIETDAGATVTIYRFQDFLDAGSAACLITHYEHVLPEEDRTGFQGDADREYPPAHVAWEDWYTHRGERA